MDLDELTRVARHAAQEGARVALSWQQPGAGRTVREKAGPRDLVSQADLEAEQVIRRVLREHRPDDRLLGEEQGFSEGSTGVTWLVDPIDGTTSYLYGRGDWAVSVAALGHDGRIVSGVVAEPAYGRITCATRGQGTVVDGQPASVTSRTELGEALVEINFGRPDQHARAGRMVDALLPRVRDLRRGGSAASSLSHVAAGRADAVWSPGLQPWDGAAGILLVLEAGGVVGDLDGPSGGRWPASGDVLAAPEALWEPLRRLLVDAYSDAG
jgi:myo-inositol-1(or 4)-monophosphatase